MWWQWFVAILKVLLWLHIEKIFDRKILFRETSIFADKITYTNRAAVDTIITVVQNEFCKQITNSELCRSKHILTLYPIGK